MIKIGNGWDKIVDLLALVFGLTLRQVVDHYQGDPGIETLKEGLIQGFQTSPDDKETMQVY